MILVRFDQRDGADGDFIHLQERWGLAGQVQNLLTHTAGEQAAKPWARTMLQPMAELLLLQETSVFLLRLPLMG